MQTKIESSSDSGIIDQQLLNVDLTKKLGQGGFGVVYKGKYRGMDAAVKELLVQEFSQKAQTEFELEARIMLQLRDPSVVHLYGVTNEKPYRMVLEFCELGSLDKYLQKREVSQVSWALRFHLSMGVASGLHYLHSYNPIIIHGDLKSLNVLLTGNPAYPKVKLGDFGMARLKTEVQTKSKVTYEGTLQWTAPELFSLSGKKTVASDIYAFGMTMWEIASHEYPYSTCSIEVIRIAVKEGERAEVPEGTPSLFAKVMKNCWAQKPEDRPSAKVVLEELQTYEEKVEPTTVGVLSTTTSVLSAGFFRSTSDSSDLNKSLPVSQFFNSLMPSPNNQFNQASVISSTLTTTTTTTATVNVTPVKAPPQWNRFPGVFTTSPAAHSASSSSFLTLNQATLTYSQQVEATSKTIQDKIDQKEFSTLSKWVTEGHLVEVEKWLKKNPTLALGTGNINDLSERTFTNITILQYAACVLDVEMCELIINYAGTHHSMVQLKALTEEPQTYNTSYNVTPLVNKYQTYFDNYSKWDYAKCYRYWQKEIGGEQRKCPAWLIYAWSEEGKDVAWTKQDVNQKIKREYDKLRLDWWFKQNYNNGEGVGSTWAAVRGRREVPAAVWRLWKPYNIVGIYVNRKGIVDEVVDDQKYISVLTMTRRETLQQLKAKVEAEAAKLSISAAINPQQLNTPATISPMATTEYRSPTPY